MEITFFSARPLLIGVLSLILGIFVYSRNRRSLTNLSFLFISCNVFLWLFFYGVVFSLTDRGAALLFAKVAYIGVTFISCSTFFFVVSLLNRKEDYKKVLFIFMGSLIFVTLLFTTNLYMNGLYVYAWGFYLKAGLLNPVFLIFHSALYTYSLYLLFSYIQSKKVLSSDKNRIKFVFYSLFIPFFSSLDFVPNYGFSFPPVGYVFIIVWLSITAFAIVRYRLMDITLVLTRTTIFIAVYSLVLGIPFLLAFGAQDWLKSYIGETWWLAPLILLTVLATAGPFIYLYIQRRAEEKLFADQRRYQTTLRQAATGMGRIKDMEKLVGLIVHIVTRSVRVEHSVVFLKDKNGKKYNFEGARSRYHTDWKVKEMDVKSPLIRLLLKAHQPLVYAELKQRAADDPHSSLDQVVEEMEQLHAELIVPSFIDENMVAFMVMGRKVSDELYSDDDISVFSILASQAALAIENCQFYRDMRATHEQLFQAEKMATIGIMADGLSHQINNRLHAMGFIAGDALDTLTMKKDLVMSNDVKEVMVDLEHALARIQENVTQGGEIVRGLLKYSRQKDEKFSEVELSELVDEAFKMAQFKIKKDNVDLVTDFSVGLPRIKGNFTELQEVFFNLIDNAYDAMMQRKEELKEEGYRPTIEIKAEPRGSKWLNILLKDNGVGIKQEDKHKVFTPFFTTKLSSKKGTGLGLYVIRKLIEENHKGKVIYRSEYMKGTRVYITLPAC